jgi:glucose/arabinose dehydrogenase
VRRTGGLVFVTSSESGRERISVLVEQPRHNGYVLAGAINFTFPPGWEHVTYALAVTRKGRDYEVFFNIGSSGNQSQSTDTVTATGLVDGVLEGASLYRVTIRRQNRGVTASGLTRIASGLRNAAGIAIDPSTGDLYFEDNGIDHPLRRSDQLSVDELNRIPHTAIGGTVESFGFPDNYVAYRSGEFVGGQGLSPVCAFQPLGDPPSESEGASDIAFAPSRFPAAMRGGIFIGVFGEYGKSGLANGENPVLFCDPATGRYSHFISNDEPQVAHLTGLLSTRDSLFLADLTHTAALGASGAGAGVIYQIQARPAPAQPKRLPQKDAQNSVGR